MYSHLSGEKSEECMKFGNVNSSNVSYAVIEHCIDVCVYLGQKPMISKSNRNGDGDGNSIFGWR